MGDLGKEDLTPKITKSEQKSSPPVEPKKPPETEPQNETLKQLKDQVAIQDIQNQLAEEPLNYAPIKSGIFGKELKGGTHAVVNEVNIPIGGKDHVIKTGQTKTYTPPIAKWLRLKLPRKLTSSVLQKTLGPNMDILPTQESIKRKYNEEYKPIKEYFGGGKSEELLQALSNPDNPFYKKMAEVLDGTIDMSKLVTVLEKHKEDNFLKDESLVIGLPPDVTRKKIDEIRAKGETPPVTYYIVQEKVTGDKVVPLVDITEQDLEENPELTERLLIFALLDRKMFEDTGRMIDTRREQMFSTRFREWFQDTANILIDMDDKIPYFIDTRWLWDNNTRIIGNKGLNLIDALGRTSLDRAINRYASILSKQEQIHP